MIALQHIHPMIVHFPIVFFLTLVAFDAIAVIRGVNVTGRTATGNISAGLAALAAIAALVAAGFGDLALDIAKSHGLQSDYAQAHAVLGVITALTLVAWAVVRGLLWRRDIRPAGASVAAVPMVETIIAGLVVLTAYFGGVLVFELGVNVNRAVGGG